MRMELRMVLCKLRQALMYQHQWSNASRFHGSTSAIQLTQERPARHSSHSQPEPELVAGPGSTGPAPLL